MTQIREVSDRIRTEQKSFLISGAMHTKYFPKIIVDGKEAFISDEKTPTGLVECETREEARQKAREHRDLAKSRIEGGRP